MNNKKKSFVLYLDNWPELDLLDMEQRGLVLTVVFGYAAQLADGENVSYFALVDSFPQLSDAGRMACGFLCATLERDHIKWVNRKLANQRRKGIAAPSESGGLDDVARADMEFARRILQGKMKAAAE